jgi:hypothetical protein
MVFLGERGRAGVDRNGIERLVSGDVEGHMSIFHHTILEGNIAFITGGEVVCIQALQVWEAPCVCGTRIEFVKAP